MLNHLKFDGESIPDPVSYSEDSGVVDNQLQTESGHTQAIVVRTGIWSASPTFQVTNRWLKKLEDYSNQDSVEVTHYDAKEDDDVVSTCIIRNFKKDLVKDSEKTPGTKGLWTVTFDIQEL